MKWFISAFLFNRIHVLYLLYKLVMQRAPVLMPWFECTGSCLHEPENGMYTMMVREDTNHGATILRFECPGSCLHEPEKGICTMMVR